ncbi:MULTISPECIES: hypothetical protein [unclassified Acinetobacter]|uniref:hypothetical protein n=1 Tax=unclassified Acinetobacter TaxID=196816 RepID=UPI002449951A|nr:MULTISPECIES: hypothetical protein [unclassified Acinetobacter]MDH0030133.1 hypothetical protein [Acinetobacter sp. GD04021]MDH0885035.1 hypothetical protein [Acinetobacter sp. GD03873]MDH1082321.1 hypothetical protein [Acinetobacter sp. GD03983]MDH2188524.1 hypothetical protein [Acinetobacter sp. GD03645]MDH2201953.1 hypothetical protein [Acinetobacter sp. GD03647]
MENKQHHYTDLCVVLFMITLSSMGHTAQPLSEVNLALQTGVLNNALPRIIVKAQQDALKPEEERWRAQRALSDWNLREIRINTLLESVLSPHEEQKKTKIDEINEKKEARMKPHAQAPDRFMIYQFDTNDNVHAEITIHTSRE